jgi:SAD/SRA domain
MSRAPQRGVSGNKTDGCDSIIVSGLRPDGIGYDKLFSLMYAAGRKEGALAILTSKDKGIPIRVFRSTLLKTAFRAICKEKSPARYRFDGLYRVTNMGYQDTKIKVSGIKNGSYLLSPPTPAAPVYLFDLVRVEEGEGVFTNKVSSEKFIQFCIDKKSLAPEALHQLTA